MRGNYDFELLVTPEEFKKNKERHTQVVKQKNNDLKEMMCYVAWITFVIAIIVMPAIIENIF